MNAKQLLLSSMFKQIFALLVIIIISLHISEMLHFIFSFIENFFFAEKKKNYLANKNKCFEINVRNMSSERQRRQDREK